MSPLLYLLLVGLLGSLQTISASLGEGGTNISGDENRVGSSKFSGLAAPLPQGLSSRKLGNSYDDENVAPPTHRPRPTQPNPVNSEVLRSVAQEPLEAQERLAAQERLTAQEPLAAQEPEIPQILKAPQQPGGYTPVEPADSGVIAAFNAIKPLIVLDLYENHLDYASGSIQAPFAAEQQLVPYVPHYRVSFAVIPSPDSKLSPGYFTVQIDKQLNREENFVKFVLNHLDVSLPPPTPAPQVAKRVAYAIYEPTLNAGQLGNAANSINDNDDGLYNGPIEGVFSSRKTAVNAGITQIKNIMDN